MPPYLNTIPNLIVRFTSFILYCAFLLCCSFLQSGCTSSSDTLLGSNTDLPDLAALPSLDAQPAQEEETDMTRTQSMDMTSAMEIEMDMTLDDPSQPDLSIPLDMMLSDMNREMEMHREMDMSEVLVELDSDLPVEVDMMMPDLFVPPPPVECGIQITLDSPSSQSFYHQGTFPTISGVVRDAQMQPVIDASVHVVSQSNVILHTIQSDQDGRFTMVVDALNDLPGFKEPQIQVSIEDQVCAETQSFSFYVCERQISEDFNLLPPNWILFQDASWDQRGWLEMTGIQTGKKGAVYNTVDEIQRGIASIQFTIVTGGGSGGGADGFAFTVVELNDSETFLDLLNAAAAGGGLGYGVSGPHAGDDYSLEGDAFTVEIDTWNNPFDPTPQNHVAVTQNGDASDHVTWFEVANIEDLMPHIIKIDFLNESMRITFDGEVIIERDVPFLFKGGYMFFSGSTGWATNYHRFDDLNILHGCE